MTHAIEEALGLTLASDGTLSGKPTATGTFTFTVKSPDSGTPSQSAAQSLSIIVVDARPVRRDQIAQDRRSSHGVGMRRGEEVVAGCASRRYRDAYAVVARIIRDCQRHVSPFDQVQSRRYISVSTAAPTISLGSRSRLKSGTISTPNCLATDRAFLRGMRRRRG